MPFHSSFYLELVHACACRLDMSASIHASTHWGSVDGREDAGKDLRAWLSTSQAPCLLKKGVEIRQILAGFDHTMALLSNGQVAGWGNNKLGQVKSVCLRACV
eukprot:2275482-Rhodomonas_salina.3